MLDITSLRIRRRQCSPSPAPVPRSVCPPPDLDAAPTALRVLRRSPGRRSVVYTARERVVTKAAAGGNGVQSRWAGGARRRLWPHRVHGVERAVVAADAGSLVRVRFGTWSGGCDPGNTATRRIRQRRGRGVGGGRVVALNVAVTMNRESASLGDTRNPPSFLSSTSVLVAAAANDAAGRPWGYGPENGPAAWSALSPTFQLCQDGKMQSPVALSERDSIAMRYSPDSPPFELRTNEALWRLRPRSAADAEHATLVFEEFIPPPPPIVGDVPPVSGFAEPPPAALLTLHELPAEPPPPPPAGTEDNAATTTTTSEMSPIIKLSDSQALTYRLTSLHFHAPQSEHVLERVRGDLEMHAVFHNVADAKDVAVISRIWRAPPPSPPTVDEAIPGGAPATPMASVEESPPVPAWIEALLTLAENSSGNAASDTEAPAAVQVASTAPVAVADHTAAARIHEVSLRAAQVAQFNFADALVRSSPFRQPVVTTPVGGIESSMTLPTEESDQEVLPNFFFYRAASARRRAPKTPSGSY
eukprot:ctg_897.g371